MYYVQLSDFHMWMICMEVERSSIGIKAVAGGGALGLRLRMRLLLFPFWYIICMHFAPSYKLEASRSGPQL